jgi:hypothetical protein
MKRASHPIIGTRRTAPQLLLPDSQFFQLDLIKPRGVLDQRLISTHLHILDDRAHDAHQLRIKHN